MKRVFVMNGGTRFYIIDGNNEKLLLQRCSDGEIVVAHGYKFETHGYTLGTDTVVWWNHGSYFGHNLLGAVKAFYGEKNNLPKVFCEWDLCIYRDETGCCTKDKIELSISSLSDLEFLECEQYEEEEEL